MRKQNKDLSTIKTIVFSCYRILNKTALLKSIQRLTGATGLNETKVIVHIEVIGCIAFACFLYLLFSILIELHNSIHVVSIDTCDTWHRWSQRKENCADISIAFVSCHRLYL